MLRRFRSGRRTAERGGRLQEADPDTKVGGIAADRLLSFIERVERLEEERKALGNDIKDIFAESKSAGFDVAVLKQLLRLLKKEPSEVEEQETLLDCISARLGCSGCGSGRLQPHIAGEGDVRLVGCLHHDGGGGRAHVVGDAHVADVLQDDGLSAGTVDAVAGKHQAGG